MTSSSTLEGPRPARSRTQLEQDAADWLGRVRETAPLDVLGAWSAQATALGVAEAWVRHADDDDDVRQAAAWAVLLHAAGALTLEQAAERLAERRAETERAWAGLRSMVVQAVSDGLSEAATARLCGISRLTVRKMLGKG